MTVFSFREADSFSRQSMELKNSRALRFIYRAHLFCLTISIFFLSTCALLTTISSTRTTCADIKSWMNAEEGDLYHERQPTLEVNRAVAFNQARRYLGGLGSSPPRCTSKCGRCTPCKPVHVAVPPGTPVTAEYYPEAWRCKCGNRLYIP